MNDDKKFNDNFWKNKMTNTMTTIYDFVDVVNAENFNWKNEIIMNNSMINLSLLNSRIIIFNILNRNQIDLISFFNIKKMKIDVRSISKKKFLIKYNMLTIVFLKNFQIFSKFFFDQYKKKQNFL